MNFKKRIQSLQKAIDWPVLVSDVWDIFYYSGYQAGMDERPLLLVKRQGKPVLWLSPLAGAVKAYAEIEPLGKTIKALPRTLGIDEAHLPASLYLELKRKRRLIPCGETIKKDSKHLIQRRLEIIGDIVGKNIAG